jgi:hypothetical protein
MLAALNGHFALVKKLRANGADINQKGWAALAYAATNGHDEIVRYLLAEGANIDAPAPNGTTPLMMAVRGGKLDTVDLLISRGANPNVRNDAGASALDWARREGFAKIEERLKRAGVRG